MSPSINKILSKTSLSGPPNQSVSCCPKSTTHVPRGPLQSPKTTRIAPKMASSIPKKDSLAPTPTPPLHPPVFHLVTIAAVGVTDTDPFAFYGPNINVSTLTKTSNAASHEGIEEKDG